MQSLFDIIQERGTQKPLKGSENNFIINQFLKPLNEDRSCTNRSLYRIAYNLDKNLTTDQFKRSKAYLRPLTHGRLAKMFKGWSTQRLYPFLANCKDANNFSSYFWWKYKEINNKTEKPH